MLPSASSLLASIRLQRVSLGPSPHPSTRRTYQAAALPRRTSSSSSSSSSSSTSLVSVETPKRSNHRNAFTVLNLRFRRLEALRNSSVSRSRSRGHAQKASAFSLLVLLQHLPRLGPKFTVRSPHLPPIVQAKPKAESKAPKPTDTQRAQVADTQ